MAIKALERGNWRLDEAVDGFFNNPPSPPPPERDAINEEKVEELFRKYKCNESEEEIIKWEGIERLFQDIGVDPNDVVVFVFSFHSQAKVFSEISLTEFQHAAEEIQFDTLQKLKGKIECLKAELYDEMIFKNFYQWVFTYAKESTSKVLDIEGSIGLWSLIFAERFKYLKQWEEFLKNQKKLRVVSKDTWNQFLEFIKIITLSGVEKYDDSGSMPEIFDDFVRHLRGEVVDDSEEDEDL